MRTMITEDALNCIRSEILLENTAFFDNYADAVDLDFCVGELKNLKFKNIGNDALDFSGSNLKIDFIQIFDAKDKGISIGEESEVYGSNISIIDSKIGIVSKDKSKVYFRDVNLKNLKVGLSAYQKKEEFGPSMLSIYNYTDENNYNLFLLERESTLTLNNIDMKTNTLDALADLYNNSLIQ